VLYIYPTTKLNEVKAAPKEDLSQLYKESRETFRAKNFKDIASVELTDDKAVKIILPSDILFNIGQAEINTAASGSLVAVGELIKDKGYAVTVAGHTDNIPIKSDKFPSNWELSTARACGAANFLIDEMDIPPERIQVIGYAEYRPIASNETPEGRSANRRVEVIISKNHKKKQITDN
jgi:chemotaxis protein MotB